MGSSKQFFSVQTIEEALAQLFLHIGALAQQEMLPASSVLGRITARPIHAPGDLPAFERSAMDGYAVMAGDTFGASDALPAYLRVIGQVRMGAVPDIVLERGAAVEIHTGAMLPQGADAVVMVERTQQVPPDQIEVLAPVAAGENVVHIGEDVAQNSIILPPGHRIRSQDIGGLLAAGIYEVPVKRRPRIGILSSGDELVDAVDEPSLGQIRDINAPMLAALCSEAGADTELLGIARDSMDDLLPLARKGFEACDMLVLSAGSSVSIRDLTFDVINQLGKPGVLQHGLAVKPGKPTIVAACDGKPVIGLPGNPVSALLVARQIVVPTIRFLLGSADLPIVTLLARLTQNIASATGREDTIPVRLSRDGDQFNAEPIFGKSNLIFTLLQADGLVQVPLNSGGYRAGAEVQVSLF